MADYIVSARKYRPKNFELVIGQAALTTTLKNAIITGKIAQAYLFCGPRGVGKTTCARIFAKTINCTNLQEGGEACGECESCRSFNEQRSLNVFELDAASNNSVDDIRQLVDQVRIPPQIGRYKVYIIDEVHMLSNQAFNAFLKTLEEPPKHAIFILATTEKQKIIPTILSRCQIYDFNRINVEDIVQHLTKVAEMEGIHAEPDALNIIAQKADGGMRDALSIFDQVVSFSRGEITYKNVIENLNVLDYEYYFRLTDHLLKGQVSDSLLLLNSILQKGFDAGNFITGLGSHLRDVLVSKDESTLGLLEVGASIRERYKEQAKNCPERFLYKAMRICSECALNYRNSRNKRFHVECTLIQLAQIMDPDDPSDGRKPDEKKPILKPISEFSAPAGATGKPQAVAPKPAATAKPAAAIPKAIAKLSEKAIEKTVSRTIGSLTVSLKPKDTDSSDRESPKTAPQPQQAAEMASTFSQVDLERCWREYAKGLGQADGGLSRLMLSTVPNINEGFRVSASVSNAIAQKSLEARINDIEGALRTGLSNSSIHLEVLLMEAPTSLNMLTRGEQFNALLKKSKVLEELKEDLGLEIN